MQQELSAIAVNLSRLIQDGSFFSSSQDGNRDDAFTALSLRLFRWHYQLNLPYRTLCEARGITPDQVQSWRTLPAVSSTAFKEFSFSCLPQVEQTHFFQSSGTTQERRSRTLHSRESLRLYEASLLSWFRRHLISEAAADTRSHAPSIRFLSLTPPAPQAPHSSLVHMLDTVARHTRFAGFVFAGTCGADDGWDLDFGQVQATLGQSVKTQVPLLLAGTAFNFVHLIEALRSARSLYRLPPGSRIMETGGYKGRSRELSRDHLHFELTRALGVPSEFIVTEYGMSELGSQAYDHTVGAPVAPRVLRFPPWARATVVSPETGLEVAEGEMGLARIVDLANAFSVLAVETEDLMIRRSEGMEFVGRIPQAEPRGCSLMAV